MSSDEDACLARVVSIEELGRSIFLYFSIVGPRATYSSSATSVLFILERFF
jgi:hypothetical protein